MGEFHSGGAFM
jgi:hypothetical protein